jgi:nucleoside-diphosphate-sugar epimerase
MRILLIGHQGYLGAGLLSYFNRHHDAIGWDRQEDLFNLTATFLARERIDLLINLAVAADRTSSTFVVDAPTDKVNVQGARHLAKVLKGTEVAWFQMSTREVLGPVYNQHDVVETDAGYRPKFLVKEDFPYAPQNYYGKSKIVAEFISESHPRSDVIRLSTGYTDFDHPASNWVLALIRAALSGKPVSLTRAGLQFRDPLHTDDLGRLMELLFEKQVFLQKIHAGGGNENVISLREFVRIANPQAMIETVSGGDYGFAFDIGKATSLTGWRPKIQVRERIGVLVQNIGKSVR